MSVVAELDSDGCFPDPEHGEVIAGREDGGFRRGDVELPLDLEAAVGALRTGGT